MTISDEPDEDADFLDDEGLMDSLIRPDSRLRIAGAHSLAGANDARMIDWPQTKAAAAAERGTTAWFRANHTDWSAQMEAVLRGWVSTRAGRTDSEVDTTGRTPSSAPGPEEIEPE